MFSVIHIFIFKYRTTQSCGNFHQYLSSTFLSFSLCDTKCRRGRSVSSKPSGLKPMGGCMRAASLVALFTAAATSNERRGAVMTTPLRVTSIGMRKIVSHCISSLVMRRCRYPRHETDALRSRCGRCTHPR